MKAEELKKRYLDFFVKKRHKLLPNVSLVPENDPSVLFTTAGMHPLVPYLLGEIHPLGKRLCSLQKCLRTDDIDNVGDGFHHTFFEMLGNWSLGDYWKEEALSWSLEFLTKELKIPSKRISISCFAGDADAPKDEESAAIWQKLGIPSTRIYFLPKKDNWWGPAGKTGPCGPDSEMFYDTGKPKCSPRCDVSCQCGKYVEVWNDVFMQYNKTAEGKYEPLKQKNVDTGMGVERTVAVTSGFNDDDYLTELFAPIVQEIEEISGKKYQRENQKPIRIIADHLRAATFILADGVLPANVEQGYILRRLIRRAVRLGQTLGINEPFTSRIAQVVIDLYQKSYPHLDQNKSVINMELSKEEEKFQKTLMRGLKEFERALVKIGVGQKIFPGEVAFFLYETYGFPLELTTELAQEKGLTVEKEGFEEKQNKHQQISRAGAEKKFAGGLVDHSAEVARLHTATHLLHKALRDILGTHVRQVGSNITKERLRFDFTHPDKLNRSKIERIERLINQKIEESLPVKMEITSLDQALKKGALAFFGEKYGEKVKVYAIGNYSLEVCGGPHAANTGSLGIFKIIKEEAVGTGRRRLYGKLLK